MVLVPRAAVLHPAAVRLMMTDRWAIVHVHVDRLRGQSRWLVLLPTGRQFCDYRADFQHQQCGTCNEINVHEIRRNCERNVATEDIERSPSRWTLFTYKGSSRFLTVCKLK